MAGSVHDITASDMRARVRFLASDMLGGRDTPSPGLDVTANYVAAEFRRLGLEAPQGGYIQRYRLVRTEMGAGWSLSLAQGRRRVNLKLGEDFWGVPWAAGTVEGPLRFVGDRLPEGAGAAGAAAVWVARLSVDVTPRQWLAAATEAGALGLVFVLPADLRYQVTEWLVGDGKAYDLGDIEPSLPAALIAEAALASALEGLGLEVSPAGFPPQLDLTARLSADMQVETAAAPNVIGILPGSDPELRDQYVMVSAHMDGLGIGPAVDGDSIYNGADDNASGVAALLEIAEAFASLGKRPGRSLVFLTVSGEEKGLLGSSWFVRYPPIPLERVVADLNIDMIGRNWEDTIAVIGKSYSTLGALIDSVAAANPSLHITPIDDPWPAERFFWRSDHFNFARKGIPAVFFFSGVHEDYHRPSDEVGKIKVAKAARITRLIFEVAFAAANAEDPPVWDPRARDAIVERQR